jgi:hypothetical protein
VDRPQAGGYNVYEIALGAFGVRSSDSLEGGTLRRRGTHGLAGVRPSIGAGRDKSGGWTSATPIFLPSVISV